MRPPSGDTDVELQDLKINRSPKAARRRSNRWGPKVLLLAAAGALLGLTWPWLSRMLDQLNLPEVQALVVTESNPASAAAVRGTAANGYIVAARRAALSSDVPGRIVELNVQEGSVVKKGDIVARLFADDFRAAYEQAKSAADAAGSEWLRAKANQEVAAAQWTEAKRAYDRAVALRDEGAEQAKFAQSELERVRSLAQAGIEGDRAKQLAERDRDAARARLQSLEAGVAAAEAATSTAESRVVAAVHDAATRHNQSFAALAARDQAKATLDKTDVRAPFDGVVVLKDAEVGEVVSPNAQGGSNARGAVCTMVDFDSLEVQANVPENTLKSVAVGAPADVFLDAFPDDRYAGTVDRIWPTADRQKATVEVRIKLQKRDARLRPEMGVRIVFRSADQPEPEPSAAQPRILIPQEAIVRAGGETGAFLIERDAVRFTAIRTGMTKGGRVAVEAGLEPNQRIVLAPPPSLRDGDRIRLRKD